MAENKPLFNTISLFLNSRCILFSWSIQLWKKWYNNCFDVEVIPVRMTSEERREASVRFLREREVTSREQVPRILSTFQAPVAPNSNYSSNRHYPLFRSNQRRLTNMAGLRNAPS